MLVKIKRIDQTLPLPNYHTSGACAFDIYARQAVTIPAKGYARIPSNLIIRVPDGYALLVSLRSSTPKKHHLLLPNSPGIIDQDYCGPKDEVRVAVYNYGDAIAAIERGERFAQATLVKIDRAEWREMTEVAATTRGGFGSTG